MNSPILINSENTIPVSLAPLSPNRTRYEDTLQVPPAPFKDQIQILCQSGSTEGQTEPNWEFIPKQ